MGDLVVFLRDRFVPVFERGVASLERRASAGDEAAETALADILAVHQVVLIELDDGGALHLLIERGMLRIVDEPPPGVPVRVAVALPVEAMALWIRDADSVEATDDSAERLARSVSKRFDDALGQDPLNFHVVFTDVPEVDEYVVRVGLGAETAPAQPGFTAAIPWAALDQLRDSSNSLQTLFMSGQVRFSGDYGRAMQLAVRLIEPPTR